MRSTKLKLKKHLSNFVAFLVFANTLGTGRAFAADTMLGMDYSTAAAEATGSVDGKTYTVAQENSTGTVKSLSDGEIGYNYLIVNSSMIEKGGDELWALVTFESISEFDELKQAMNNAPAKVE
ncbi:MAG: hypothetical protein ACI4PK_02475 [Oscillospiraceae bacterium]